MATKEFMAKVIAWTSADAQDFLQRAKAALVDRWLELAGGLGGSLAAYQAAMDVRDEGRVLRLVLRDSPKLANLVEFGCAPFDMRQTLLRLTTRSIRRAKDGHLYLFVPLRKSTRTIVDLAGSRAYAMAKALKAYPGSGSGRLPAGLTPKLQPYHATDPLDSLVRTEPDGPGGGSVYMTWRTISQIGRPWLHRGIVGRNFMQQVANEAPSIVARLRGD